MASGSFRFDQFLLDPADRRLSRDGEPLELNARYLDALTLLVREQGRLVSKDRFLDEVWRGVPVTDEALTQCIRTLRQRLGDDAGRPRFIETVPKHGYRFVAPVESAGAHFLSSSVSRTRDPVLLGAAGTAGGGLAGILGGLFYGFAGASQPGQPGVGAISILLVILAVTLVLALLGAACVSFGIAAASFVSRRFGPWVVAGGALGGLIVGAAVKLLGLDAFTLLIGRSPGDITGPLEGIVLGAATGLGAWVTCGLHPHWSLRRSAAAAGAAGAVAGLLIALAGGRLMGGSLALLAQHFPDSRLRLDDLGQLLGEQGFGPVTRTVTSVLEGMLFAACVVGGMVFVRAGRREAVTDRAQIPQAAAGTSRA